MKQSVSAWYDSDIPRVLWLPQVRIYIYIYIGKVTKRVGQELKSSGTPVVAKHMVGWHVYWYPEQDLEETQMYELSWVNDY